MPESISIIVLYWTLIFFQNSLDTSSRPVNYQEKVTHFFYTQFLTESGTKKVQIIENARTNKKLFSTKWELKSPIKLSGLSPTSSSLVSFNSNTGSRMGNLDIISFQYEKAAFKKISDINDMPIKTIRDVKVCF